MKPSTYNKTTIRTLCIATLTAMLTLGSCNDFLDEYSQDLYYAHNWEDLDELLIGSAYMSYETAQEPSRWGDLHVGQFLHYLTDDLNENTEGSYQEYDCQEVYFGNYTWQERTGVTPNFTSYNAENSTWTRCYFHINVCNNILASLNDVNMVDDEDQQGYHKVAGEAYFLRAYYYFFLVNLYGKPYDANAAQNPGVPIKLSENVEDKKYERNSVKEVYDQILSDLEQARTHLTQYNKPQHSYLRADSVAANMLTARVYQYMQDWDKASLYAEKVIRMHPELENLRQPSDTYFHSKANVETIFSMGGNDVPCLMFNGIKTFGVTDDLYTLYATTDLRRTQWYWTKGSFKGVTKTRLNPIFWGSTYQPSDIQYYYYGMYYNSQGSNTYYSTVFGMRSAEAYLIKAEADAYRGREGNARNILNTLRTNRYSRYMSTDQITSSGSELIQDIRNERRRELCFEGHRWFDLRRYTVDKVYPESHPIQHTFTYYADRESPTPTSRVLYTLQAYDGAYTLPIPNEVITFNTGMKQNPRPKREPENLPITITEQ